MCTAKQRVLVNCTYSLRSMGGYEDKVDEAIDIFGTRIQKRDNAVMDMGSWLELFALSGWDAKCAQTQIAICIEVVDVLTFSNRSGFLEAGEEAGLFKNIEGALLSASWLG